MIPTNEMDTFWMTKFETGEKRYRLNAEQATVNVVTCIALESHDNISYNVVDVPKKR